MIGCAADTGACCIGMGHYGIVVEVLQESGIITLYCSSHPTLAGLLGPHHDGHKVERTPREAKSLHSDSLGRSWND